jgi:amino acid transporter
MAINWMRGLKTILVGESRDLSDHSLFRKVSLVALFAWVGLGADGLSSSCYGPESAYLALQQHTSLSVFIALATVITIGVICASYAQIIEVFPAGGGGYLVASKLLSPTVGMVSGCALIVDYILTIALSIAAASEAIFSMLPESALHYKLTFALTGVVVLTLVNLRGVKESVLPFVPVFLLFLLTHAFAILYTLLVHIPDLPKLAVSVSGDVRAVRAQLGLMGTFLLVLHAYSMGAGTYTGIETVSNGMPILREPRVATGKRTMLYMAVSLATTVAGLLVMYLLYHVAPERGKTLNAVVFGHMVGGWHWTTAFAFVLLALFSEAALLFVGAQAGFLGGPRVLSYMALDKWFPSRFTSLSDRFVTQNGVLLMGGAAFLLVLFSSFRQEGVVAFLVVLYSINVFITFTLSQIGMVRHWWQNRATVPTWKKKLLINGIGVILTGLILISLSIIKFWEGGWITLFVTGFLVVVAFWVKHHYAKTAVDLKRLDDLVAAAQITPNKKNGSDSKTPAFDPKAKTAIVLVSGFNGLGLHTLFGIMRMFPNVFRNFIFIQVGVVDAGNFKGAAEIERLKEYVTADAERYVTYMRQNGYYAEAQTALGTDVVTTAEEIAVSLLEKYPQAVFFGGQLVFPHESWVNRMLHNYVVFALQRRFYRQGFPFLILPIRV